METKAFITSLGFKSASLYIPIYNIIKEVFWEGKAELTEKNTVEVTYMSESGMSKCEYQRN